jgi:hypothetical protein
MNPIHDALTLYVRRGSVDIFSAAIGIGYYCQVNCADVAQEVGDVLYRLYASCVGMYRLAAIRTRPTPRELCER